MYLVVVSICLTFPFLWCMVTWCVTLFGGLDICICICVGICIGIYACICMWMINWLYSITLMHGACSSMVDWGFFGAWRRSGNGEGGNTHQRPFSWSSILSISTPPPTPNSTALYEALFLFAYQCSSGPRIIWAFNLLLYISLLPYEALSQFYLSLGWDHLSI